MGWLVDKVLVSGRPTDPPLFVFEDLAAALSLFVQNLTNLVVISQLSQSIVGIPLDTVKKDIVPGTAAVILVGSVYFWWQGRCLARNESRQDVCAQPYGINTPDVFSFIFNIMAVVGRGGGHVSAYRAGLLANFMSGVVTLAVAPFGGLVQRTVPRPALFSALAGIAITFLAFGPLINMYSTALVSLVPTFVLVLVLTAKVRLPGNCPPILLQWGLSIGLGWTARLLGGAFAGEFHAVSLQDWEADWSGLYPPRLALTDWVDGFEEGFKYTSVWLPLAVVAVAEIIINVSIAAELGHDRYPLPATLVANALSSLVGPVLGTPFPAVTFIGHPTFKEMGARTGYVLLQGVLLFVLATCGGFTFLLTFMPEQASYPMVIFIGLDIFSAAFAHSEPHSVPAVTIGLLPAMANFIWGLLNSALTDVFAAFPTPTNLAAWIDRPGLAGSPVFIKGLIRLSQGFVLTGMLYSTVTHFLLAQQLLKASLAFAVLGVLSALGLIHSFVVDPKSGVVSSQFVWDCGCVNAKDEVLTYGTLALGLAVAHFCQRQPQAQPTQALQDVTTEREAARVPILRRDTGGSTD